MLIACAKNERRDEMLQKETQISSNQTGARERDATAGPGCISVTRDPSYGVGWENARQHHEEP
jgi:hypothetical protein